MSPVVLAPPALLPAASECQLLLAHHTCWQLPRHQRPSHLLRPHRRLLLQHTDQLPLLPQHAAQLMQWLAKTQLGPLDRTACVFHMRVYMRDIRLFFDKGGHMCMACDDMTYRSANSRTSRRRASCNDAHIWQSRAGYIYATVVLPTRHEDLSQLQIKCVPCQAQ